MFNKLSSFSTIPRCDSKQLDGGLFFIMENLKYLFIFIMIFQFVKIEKIRLKWSTEMKFSSFLKIIKPKNS